jgi:lipopolysaccharide transport system ATP-binding protein
MTDLAIKVDNLSKRYRIGTQSDGYRTLRDTLADGFKSLLRRNGRRSVLSPRHSTVDSKLSAPSDTFWALRDVSFQVKRGEVVGIIGRNGAGKSTLLKILSRVTRPTRGRVKINGRVGSLLEVGTGFHPELTGRENIYLNGAVLGMTKAEIGRKFDEIIEFAEIHRFLDTPVKRYSSGMYMRLAFSIAAHLEPEILLVDEVLAVGDQAFQQKCIGKMSDVAKEGRTILFVSHNMACIQRLCHSAILLDEGQIRAFSKVPDVIQTYLREVVSPVSSWKLSSVPTKHAYFRKIYLADEKDEQVKHVTTASSLSIIMEYVVQSKYRGLQISVDLLDSNGDLIFASNPQDKGLDPPEEPGQYRAVVRLPPQILLPKTYGIRTNLWTPWEGILDTVSSLRLSVIETLSLSNATPEGKPGQILVPCDWLIKQSNSISPVERFFVQE